MLGLNLSADLRDLDLLDAELVGGEEPPRTRLGLWYDPSSWFSDPSKTSAATQKQVDADMARLKASSAPEMDPTKMMTKAEVAAYKARYLDLQKQDPSAVRARAQGIINLVNSGPVDPATKSALDGASFHLTTGDVAIDEGEKRRQYAAAQLDAELAQSAQKGVSVLDVWLIHTEASTEKALHEAADKVAAGIPWGKVAAGGGVLVVLGVLLRRFLP